MTFTIHRLLRIAYALGVAGAIAVSCFLAIAHRSSAVAMNDHRSAPANTIDDKSRAVLTVVEYVAARNGIPSSSDVSANTVVLGGEELLDQVCNALGKVGLHATVDRKLSVLAPGERDAFIVCDGNLCKVVDHIDQKGIATVFSPDDTRTAVPLEELRAPNAAAIVVPRPDMHSATDSKMSANSDLALRWETFVIDRGEINRTAGTVAFEYDFYNIGSHPVLISQVIPSCGCVQVDFPKEPIQPHSAGKVVAHYNVGAESGNFSKFLVVRSDDTASPEVKLRLYGCVVDKLLAGPMMIDFGSVAGGSSRHATVILRYYSRTQFKLTGYASEWPDLRVTWHAMTPQDFNNLSLGGPYKVSPDGIENIIVVDLMCQSPEWFRGSQKGTVTLKTNLVDEDYKSVTLSMERHWWE
jgi:hypothetical protein